MPFLVGLMIRLGKQMVDFKSYSVKRKNKYIRFIFKFCVNRKLCHKQEPVVKTEDAVSSFGR